MKLMRRVIVALLAVAMAASSLVACGKDNGTGKDELVTLDCYSQLANFQGKTGRLVWSTPQGRVQCRTQHHQRVRQYIRNKNGVRNLGDIVVFGNSGENYLAAVKSRTSSRLEFI